MLHSEKKFSEYPISLLGIAHSLDREDGTLKMLSKLGHWLAELLKEIFLFFIYFKIQLYKLNNLIKIMIKVF